MDEVYGGYRWEQQTKSHLQDPIFLESHGYKVFSQNDEDGILQEIFDRIGTTTKKFVEFGVQDGLECNSHYLLHKGWTGLWLEGSEPFYRQIQEKFAPVIAEGALKTDCVFITRENINEVLEKNGVQGEIDFLCIDVDGNDYHIWKAVSRVTPRVVCMEYNGKFPPDCEWVMPYSSGHVWQGNDCFGASLKSLEKLGREKGYQLVGTNLTGVNAFFVREDLAEGKFPLPATAEHVYNAPQYAKRHVTGHPSEFCLLGNGKEAADWDGPEHMAMDASFEERAVRVSALMEADRLFDALEDAASKTACIIVENGMRDYGTEQVILCFLDRYKMFLEYVHTAPVPDIETHTDIMPPPRKQGGQWRTYIKLRRVIGGLGQSSYSVLADAYTESYYMTDCGGYDDFRSSHGMEMTPRLRDVYGLVEPARGERILDVGCGRGELTFALAAAGAYVEGVDYSEDAVAIARKTFDGKRENLRYTRADIFKMDHLDAYDKIVMADVVEHIEQEVLEKIFERISACLHKSGCLIIHTAPNRDYYEITYPQIREQAGRLGCWKPRNPRSYYEQLMHINEQTPEGLEKTLRKYFRCVRVWTGGAWEMDVEKTADERRMDIEIYAIACQDSGLLEERMRKFAKKPEWAGCRVQIEAADITAPAGEGERTVAVTLTNLGGEGISSRKKYPINLAYHILDQEGNMILFDGERTPVCDEIKPGRKREMQMRLRIPPDLHPGEGYICRITLVAEGCFWFDQEGGNKLDVPLRLQ